MKFYIDSDNLIKAIDELEPEEATPLSDVEHRMLMVFRLLIAKQSMRGDSPIVHAHWEIVEPWCEGPVWFKCSNCEEPYIFEEDEKYKYCPNCGAKMDEEAE